MAQPHVQGSEPKDNHSRVVKISWKIDPNDNDEKDMIYEIGKQSGLLTQKWMPIITKIVYRGPANQEPVNSNRKFVYITDLRFTRDYWDNKPLDYTFYVRRVWLDGTKGPWSDAVVAKAGKKPGEVKITREELEFEHGNQMHIEWEPRPDVEQISNYALFWDIIKNPQPTLTIPDLNKWYDKVNPNAIIAALLYNKAKAESTVIKKAKIGRLNYRIDFNQESKQWKGQIDPRLFLEGAFYVYSISAMSRWGFRTLDELDVHMRFNYIPNHQIGLPHPFDLLTVMEILKVKEENYEIILKITNNASGDKIDEFNIQADELILNHPEPDTHVFKPVPQNDYEIKPINLSLKTSNGIKLDGPMTVDSAQYVIRIPRGNTIKLPFKLDMKKLPSGEYYLNLRLHHDQGNMTYEQSTESFRHISPTEEKQMKKEEKNITEDIQKVKEEVREIQKTEKPTDSIRWSHHLSYLKIIDIQLALHELWRNHPDFRKTGEQHQKHEQVLESVLKQWSKIIKEGKDSKAKDSQAQVAELVKEENKWTNQDLIEAMSALVDYVEQYKASYRKRQKELEEAARKRKEDEEMRRKVDAKVAREEAERAKEAERKRAEQARNLAEAQRIIAEQNKNQQSKKPKYDKRKAREDARLERESKEKGRRR